MVGPSVPSGGNSIETLYVDIAARADQLVQDADVAVRAVMGHLDKLEQKNKELESSYSRLGEFIRNALGVATGMVMARMGGSLVNAIMNFGRSLIQTNAEMQKYEQTFKVLTGSAEEAGKIIEWVKEEAKKTPFDVPGLIQASKMLMTWGLDLKEWFTIVGDVAAAMDRPLSMVVNAVGTLASGQTGEAIRRFRDLGINLREYTKDLKFDARGSLLTPLEEALPIVKRIMEDKFGGMMAEQAKTWQGVMSNLSDTWQQFVQTLGEPVFDNLNAQLVTLETFISENSDALQSFARNMGNLLGAALEAMMNLLSYAGKFFALLEDKLGAGWVEEGVTTGKRVVGITAGSIRSTADFLGGLAMGEGLEEAALGAQAAWLETMLEIAGESDKTAKIVAENFTDAMNAGVAAVEENYKRYRSAFPSLDLLGADPAGIFELAMKGEEAEILVGFARRLEAVGTASEGTADMLLAENAAAIAVWHTYRDAKADYEDTIERRKAMTDAIAAERIALEELMATLTAVSEKYTEKIQDVLEDYNERIQQLKDNLTETIAAIQAKADEAVRDATEKTQDEIAKSREDFAREQIRRRRQFNQEWAKLIRDQNQEVIDAEWEYQYAKENLLIEGDEKALADLETRYKHEKNVRGREHGDARDDLQERSADEENDRQADFKNHIKDLEARLKEEIAQIEEKAAEEVRLKKEALEEALLTEDEKRDERLQKIGEALGKEIGDNQTATDAILGFWESMYGAQVAEALAAGIETRNDLQRTIDMALRAYQSVQLGLSPSLGRRPGSERRWDPDNQEWVWEGAEGGYTPGAPVSPAFVHAGEFMANAATTRVLEAATGGRLTQGTVRSLAESRRKMDVTIRGHGLPAGEIRALRAELVRALKQEGMEF